VGITFAGPNIANPSVQSRMNSLSSRQYMYFVVESSIIMHERMRKKIIKRRSNNYMNVTFPGLRSLAQYRPRPIYI